MRRREVEAADLRGSRHQHLLPRDVDGGAERHEDVRRKDRIGDGQHDQRGARVEARRRAASAAVAVAVAADAEVDSNVDVGGVKVDEREGDR